MPTHAELAAKLLTDSAVFFRTLAQHNEPIRKNMIDNATVFEQVSQLLLNDPRGYADNTSHAELAARLLRDAAAFFRTLATQNEPIREQMESNAGIFEQMADRVQTDPLEILD